ncbi:hypothetical protein HMPREF9108_00155 [Leptotrichia sp. oral taxon 225 str. F0581]|nr:hypothetical protein HMPREF9108_00155 [Leptotrichia sp. oral taxon 225 str. F0581]
MGKNKELKNIPKCVITQFYLNSYTFFILPNCKKKSNLIFKYPS